MSASRAHGAAQQHDAVPVPGPAAPEPAHRCGICGKAFERRDLRDRHKRRCVHSITRPKRSKRKSCRACAVSKLGCDQAQPSCRRCLSRNIACEYVGDATDSAADADAGAELQEPRRDVQGPGACHLDSIGYNTQESDAVTGHLADLGENGPFLGIGDMVSDEVDSVTPSNQSVSTPFGNMDPSADLPRAPATYQVAMGDVASADSHQSAPLLPLAVPGNHQVNPNWSSGMEHGGHGGFPLPDDMAGTSTSSRLPRDTFGITGSENMEWMGGQLDKSNMPFNLWSSIQNAGTHDGAPHNLGTPPASSHVRTAESGFKANRDLSALGDNRYTDRHTPRPPERDHDVAMSPEEMVSVILSYLPMMSTHEMPPFVHSQFYRHSEVDVKEPIARAMICINAYTGAMPDCRGFAHDMINTERDYLIKSFPRCSSETDMLAALHAMIVYQSLGLFSDSVEQTRSSELRQPFFLKMCRKVAQRYQRDLGDAGDSAPFAWGHWSFIETVRRTIFLANAINVLSVRLQKQNAFFYEALDDELLLELPLPAPAALWEAGFEDEWLAQASVPWRPITGRMLQQEHGAVPEGAEVFTRIVVSALADNGLPGTGTSWGRRVSIPPIARDPGTL